MAKYGIFDTEGNCWLGDERGPKTFDDFILARIAAQIADDQITGSDLSGRMEAREISDDAWRLKDELPTKRSALKSLRRIENRES